MSQIELGYWDTYTDITFADSYWTVHGLPSWWTAASTTLKTWGLVEGTNYLDATYRDRWKGERADCEQDRDWPRRDVIREIGCQPIDPAEIPREIEEATAYLAGIYVQQGTTADLIPPQTSSDGRLKRKRTRVGEIETDKEWLGGSLGNDAGYPRVEAMIWRLIEGAQGLVVRA